MDNVEVDNLLGDFASGDKTPAVVPNPIQTEAHLKREQDSTDDFEHLEREGKQDPGEVSVNSQSAARAATQGFLDMERAPSAADQLADKFTDSESDADTAGESPLHRPAPPAPLAATAPPPAPAPAPAVPPAPAPTPVAKTAPEPHPTFEAVVTSPHPEAVKPELPAQPKVEVKPAPAAVPEPPKPQPAPAAERPEPKAPAPTKPMAHVIEAEVIFCQMGLDAWFDPKRLHPQVEGLMYWRCPVRSGVALGGGLALLLALACCSVVSVASYAALLALAAALSFRLYRNVLQAVHKTNDGHPFKNLLEQDISVSAERAQQLAAAATAHVNAASAELRRLFLVEDLVDSLKFGVLLWCLTYVGACFNGITLIILAWIALFTLPKAYEMNKAQVDANLELARAKINEITAKVRAAVPLGRKSESDKDK